MKKLIVLVGLLLTVAGMNNAKAARLFIDAGGGRSHAFTWGTNAETVKNDLLAGRFVSSYAKPRTQNPIPENVRYVGIKFTATLGKVFGIGGSKKKHYYYIINRAAGKDVMVTFWKEFFRTYSLRADSGVSGKDITLFKKG